MANGNGTALRGPLKIRTLSNGVFTDVQVIDADGTISGVIPDAPTGSVTIATAKTLTVTDADALIVGGVIVPQTFLIHFRISGGAVAGDYAGSIPLPVACKLVNVKERHDTAGSDGSAVTVMVKKTPSGTAKASASRPQRTPIRHQRSMPRPRTTPLLLAMRLVWFSPAPRRRSWASVLRCNSSAFKGIHDGHVFPEQTQMPAGFADRG